MEIRHLFGRTRVLKQIGKRIVLASVWWFLVAGATTVARASDSPAENLSDAQILEKTRASYASLTSYSDEGDIYQTLNGDVTTYTFKIKVARPNFFLIQWQYPSPNIPKEAAWCDGQTDFNTNGSQVINESELIAKLSPHLSKESQALISRSVLLTVGSVSASDVPRIFFKVSPGDDALNALGRNEKRQSDDKVGDVDCYVLSYDSAGATRILWIGKQDFLIHRIEYKWTKDAAEAAALNADQDKLRQSIPNLPETPRFKPQDTIRIETHKNIVLNPKLAPLDFHP